MMVRRLVAAIKTHEGADQRTVGQAHHVGGNEPSVSMYQRTLTSKSGASSTRCPSLVTWGGSSAGRWVSFTRMIWFGALWGIAERTGSRLFGTKPCKTSTATPSGSRRWTTEPPPGVFAGTTGPPEAFDSFWGSSFVGTDNPSPTNRASGPIEMR